MRSPDMTKQEQTNVRAALRFLRVRLGGWKSVARALRYSNNGLFLVLNGKRNVTPILAFRVARLAEASIDDVLAGRWPVGVCRNCGHPIEESPVAH